MCAANSAQAGVIELNEGLDTLRAWNSITFGNLNSGHDTFGRAFVGGNYSGTTEFFAQPGASAKPGLVVVGDVTGGDVKIENGGGAIVGGSQTGGKILLHDGGNLVVGGNVNGVSGSAGATITVGGTASNVDTNGAVTVVGAVGPGNFNGPKTIQADNAADGIQAGLITQRDRMQSNLIELSQYFSTLEKTDTANIAMNGSTFNVTSGADLAVFWIDDFMSLINSDPVFNIAGADTVVINVKGKVIDTEFNFVGSDAMKMAWAPHVIWNFYEATTVKIDRAFWGTVLAPTAIGTNTSEITGTAVFATFNQNAQMHIPGYGGKLVFNAVPEPATWTMMILGFGAAGAMMRRRRAALAA
ncbi:MAG: collagen-binding domain-containing protein [Pseudomonadota bacterium]